MPPKAGRTKKAKVDWPAPVIDSDDDMAVDTLTPQQKLMEKLKDAREKAAKGENAPDALVGLMEELVNMTLDGQRKDAGEHMPTPMPKPRQKTRLSLGLEQSQGKYSDELWRQWKEKIGMAWKVKFSSHQDFILYEGIKMHALLKVLELDPATSPLYMGDGWDKSWWNQKIFEWVAQQVLLNNMQEWKLRPMATEDIVTELWGQFRTSHGYWRMAQKRDDEDEEDMQERVATQLEVRGLRAKKNARRTRVSSLRLCFGRY
jgi:hypothetical protein